VKEWVRSGSRHTVMMCWAGKAQSPSSSMSNCSRVNGRRGGEGRLHGATVGADAAGGCTRLVAHHHAPLPHVCQSGKVGHYGLRRGDDDGRSRCGRRRERVAAAAFPPTLHACNNFNTLEPRLHHHGLQHCSTLYRVTRAPHACSFTRPHLLYQQPARDKRP
jgi:hypothetical protein